MPGNLAEVVEHPVLDPSAQHAAAQQEGVDLQGVAPRGEDHNADKTVVAEPVGDLHHPAFEARVCKPLNLAVGAANGGEVELVGPLRELGNAVSLLRLRFRDPNVKVQSRQELLDGPAPVFEIGRARFPVYTSPSAVGPRMSR